MTISSHVQHRVQPAKKDKSSDWYFYNIAVVTRLWMISLPGKIRWKVPTVLAWKEFYGRPKQPPRDKIHSHSEPKQITLIALIKSQKQPPPTKIIWIAFEPAELLQDLSKRWQCNSGQVFVCSLWTWVDGWQCSPSKLCKQLRSMEPHFVNPHITKSEHLLAIRRIHTNCISKAFIAKNIRLRSMCMRSKSCAFVIINVCMSIFLAIVCSWNVNNTIDVQFPNLGPEFETPSRTG